jgi:hypothetical protein
MHNEGLCSKKWIKIGPNQEYKAMFFHKHEKHSLKPRKSNQENSTTVQTQNDHFLLLKHGFLVPTRYIIKTKLT